ncbi:MAG TPA: ATP-binding protein [Tepidisphaeraceae bacterium]|jgi:two-component system sensor histidine kinase QseC
MISLQRRFTFWSLGGVAVLSVVTAASLYIYVRTALYRQFDAGLRTRAQTLGSLLRIEDDGRYAMDFSDESMPEYLAGAKPDYFQIFGPDGAVLEKSESLKGTNLISLATARAIQGPWNLKLPDGRPGRAIVWNAIPEPDGDDHDRPNPKVAPKVFSSTPGIVVIALDRSPINATLEPLLSAFWIGGLILAAGSIVVVRFIVWQSLRPVNELAQAAENVGPRTLDYRFEIDSVPAELRLVCERLNQLLERLDQAFRRERRLNADIAHELRTPIAELRSLTEVARRWPGDAAQSATYFDDAHAIALQMGSLVNSLLTLSRSQGQLALIDQETVSVQEVLEKSFATRDEKIIARKLRVSIVASEDCNILTMRALFVRVVDNLIANAVDYAMEAGCITCNIHNHDDGCTLSISNDNDSLAEEDLKEMFEPFWRKDSARTDLQHSGLGLALVTEYAHQIGIDITAKLPERSRFEITLRIPRAIAMQNSVFDSSIEKESAARNHAAPIASAMD